MAEDSWEALAVADKKGKGSWVDFLESLKDIYGLGEEWTKMRIGVKGDGGRW